MISEMIKKWLEHVKINNLWSPLNQLSTFFKCDKILSKIYSSLTKFWKFFVTEASSALLHFSYFSYIDYFTVTSLSYYLHTLCHAFLCSEERLKYEWVFHNFLHFRTSTLGLLFCHCTIRQVTLYQQYFYKKVRISVTHSMQMNSHVYRKCMFKIN